MTATADLLDALSPATDWEPAGTLPLSFPTHHPQGIAIAGDRIFLSSVEVAQAPRKTAAGGRTAGRGTAHLFVLDTAGTLLDDVCLGSGDLYHPGGIDFDGSAVWVPVAEYRPGGRSVIYAVDADTLEPRERFRVDDHVGWVTRDPETGLVHGGSWGTRSFRTWTADGDEAGRWQNPLSFIDYQDCQSIGGGMVACGGIKILPGPSGPFELGGIGLVDAAGGRVAAEFPLPLYSRAGHVLTRNPFALTDAGGVPLLWVAPDDGDEGGTAILKYRAVPAR